MCLIASRRALWLVAMCSVVLLFFGCGPAKSQVSGKVTLDGQPVANGEINFEPADGQGQTAGCALSAGAYSLEMPPGKKRVHLTATKVVGQRRAIEEDPNSRLFDIVEPVEFTVAEPLEFDLPAGKASKDFTLTSKPQS